MKEKEKAMHIMNLINHQVKVQTENIIKAEQNLAAAEAASKVWTEFNSTDGVGFASSNPYVRSLSQKVNTVKGEREELLRLQEIQEYVQIKFINSIKE